MKYLESNIVVRGAKADDLMQLSVLNMQSFWLAYPREHVGEPLPDTVINEMAPSRLMQRLKDADTRIFVAEKCVDNELLGFALLRTNSVCPQESSSTTELESLYVQMPFWGQGIGSALLEYAECFANTICGGNLWVSISSRNSAALSFFQKQRYAHIEYDACEMTKTLQAPNEFRNTP